MADRPPKPPAQLTVTERTLPARTPLHRVHLQDYGPGQFNPGAKGNARFSPIKTGAGAPIPTIYAATTFQAAAMETVFHDVPFEPGLKTLDMAKLEGQVHSQIAANRDLQLADLSQVALRKLGVSRAQLIDTEKALYPETRPWAEAIHAQFRHLDGLTWVSRQDDKAEALMLFGDRVTDGVLKAVAPSRSLLGDDQANQELTILAEKLDVSLVKGKS